MSKNTKLQMFYEFGENYTDLFYWVSRKVEKKNQTENSRTSNKNRLSYFWRSFIALNLV